VFFARQDAGLLSAKPGSGNCRAFYCLLFKNFTPTRTDAVFCLSRRQQLPCPLKAPGLSSCREKNTPTPEIDKP
jgi:hypothetical protein